MLRSETVTQLVEALASAQGEFPTIPRDRTVKVRTRKTYADGTPIEYTFKYAPLDTILGCVRPALSKHGLSLVQSVVTDDEGAEFLQTTLFHKSGEWIANQQPLFVPKDAENASQAYASGLTYARRYGVTALLCLAADEDDDGNATTDFERTPRQGRTTAKPASSSRPAGRPEAKDARAEGDPGIYDLSESQKRLLLAKARGVLAEHAEGPEGALVAKFNRITPENVNAVLASLRELAEGGVTA